MKHTLISALCLLSLHAFAQDPNPITQNTIPETVRPTEVTDVEKGHTQGAIKKARVYFVSPKDGATVAKTFKVQMGMEGMKIRPAGEAPDEMTSGHHHVIIDAGSIPAGQPIAMDGTNLHFGKGQTETEITLTPGKHTLTLQFADGAHRSFGPKMSQTITVNVK